MRQLSKIGLAICFSFLLIPSAQAAKLACGHLYFITQGFLKKHVIYERMSDKLKQRGVDQYIRKLDSSKRYLLKKDVAVIRKKLGKIHDQIKKRNCEALKEIQKLYIKRVNERTDYAKKALGKGFKFNPKTELVVDPDARKYAKNNKELNRDQEKFIQFQVSNYLVTDMKLDEAKQYVIRSYERMARRVSEMTEEDVYANFIDSFARGLDPHSSFFSREVLEDFEIQMGLSLEGIGATLSSRDGFTIVEQLIPGGAAARSGLVEPKDKIIGVGQEKGPIENVIEMELRDVVQKIRGPKGSKVRLTLLRKEKDKQNRVTVTLVRDKINLKDEEAKLSYIEKKIGPEPPKGTSDQRLTKKVGVIRLPSFYADAKTGGRSSAKDVKRLLKEARKKKVDGIVLDLANNGGGSLEDAVKIAGLFFKTGNVVKQSSRDGSSERALKDTAPEVDWPGPLVVLTSRISASASEIVAGTLQDYERAVVLGGDHTFGKGSVQSVLPLPQKLGAIKVTVGMFFVPGGNSTQHRGVDADIVLPGPFAKDDIGEKSLDYSLPPKKIRKFVSKNAFVTTGPDAWKKVTRAEITKLKKNSKIRVAANKDFQKISDDLKKSAKEKIRTVKLSETLEKKEKSEQKKKKEEQTKPKTDAEKEKEYLARADVNEAVSVLADLIMLREGANITIGSATKKTLGEGKKGEPGS